MWVCVNEFVIIVKVCLTQTVSVGLVELMLQYGCTVQGCAFFTNVLPSVTPSVHRVHICFTEAPEVLSALILATNPASLIC